MKPIYWMFHLDRWLEERGHLRFRKRSLQPWRRGRLDYLARVDQKLVRTVPWYGRALDLLPFLPRPAADRLFADIDFGTTRAYGFASQGQLYLGELTGARNDPAYIDALAAELAEIPHPQTGEPAFEVLRKEELFYGPFLDKAPELMLIPYDERINVDPSRRRWTQAFERHERLDPEVSYGYSGHHGVTGILAATGPGIRAGRRPGRLRDHAAPGDDPAACSGSRRRVSTASRWRRSSRRTGPRPRRRSRRRRRTRRATSPSTPRRRNGRWSSASATWVTSNAAYE